MNFLYDYAGREFMPWVVSGLPARCPFMSKCSNNYSTFEAVTWYALGNTDLKTGVQTTNFRLYMLATAGKFSNSLEPLDNFHKFFWKNNLFSTVLITFPTIWSYLKELNCWNSKKLNFSFPSIPLLTNQVQTKTVNQNPPRAYFGCASIYVLFILFHVVIRSLT